MERTVLGPAAGETDARPAPLGGSPGGPLSAPFGVLLRAHRLDRGLTQEALAEQAELSVRGVQSLEAGITRPHRETARRLVDALALAGDDLARFMTSSGVGPRRRRGGPPARQTDAPGSSPSPIAPGVTYLPPARAGRGREARSRRPHNLPLQLTSFVGREDDLAGLAALLGDPASGARLVTLTGPGGVGKTRLALEAAAGLVASDGAPYSDGVWLVELASLADPALVPQAVAAVFGVREARGRPLAATLGEALRPGRLLLVLDNCEHLVVACARLADALLRACPHLRVLATGRRALGLPGEVPRAVAPLPVPPDPEPPPGALRDYAAPRLFLDRVAAVAPNLVSREAEAPAVARVCRQLDGIPLALELAAARVPGLGVSQLAARLDQRFRLLTGGSPAAPARQQTLRAAVEWSYDLLDEGARVLFRRLAFFAGGFDLAAAEAVCADPDPEEPGAPAAGAGRPVLPADDVLSRLLELVEASLVTAETDRDGAMRYRLLETMREYARERLGAAGETEASARRHAAHYLRLAEEALEHLRRSQEVHASWLERLDAEHDNLRQALGTFLDAGETEPALRLGVALRRFWISRGHLTEGRARVRALLAMPAPPGAAPVRAELLYDAASIARSVDDYAEARTLYEQAAAAYRRLGDGPDEAMSLADLGLVAREQGDWETARVYLERSLDLHRALGERGGMAHAVTRLGEVAHAVGDFPRARRHYEEALALARESEERIVLAWAPHHLGRLAIEEGDFAAAGARLAEGLRMHREDTDKVGYLHSLAAFAGLAAATGQAVRALRLAGAVAALSEAIGAPVQPSERRAFEQRVGAAREALGPGQAAMAFAAGRAMSPEQAVAYALAGSDPETPGA
jgi:predicted ATPase/DNA-binding XRE family transcriptional regulator